MPYDIGPSIGVTGEKEFKAAMASINDEFKLLGSEMKLAVSQFDKNDKSTEALTAQNQVLGKEIDSQKGRIALLTTQYDKQNTTLATLKDKLDATKLAFGADSAEVAKAQQEYDKQNRAVIALQTQLNNATTGLNNMERQLESNNQAISDNSKNLGEFGEKMKAMGAAVAVGMAAVGAGFLGAIVAGVKMSDDLTKALNGLQSSTGVTDEAMAGMKDTMLAIYNDNFGENFEEIGAAMATVAQQTGLSGDALKVTTENALLLKDTFGLEVADSIKGANQVMKQFGVDSETAYNLIAQGAQSGLDSNGDLLDTLNEYSGTFKAQGFSAEEMFNMLSNASKSGIRDVDLAADAIKEFGIRSKDGSTTSAAGFEALGLSAAEMTKQFGAGGETAKEAFAKTTKALMEMKDPVAQNAAGVALFGTQWEDLGVKGVTALVNTKGSINETTDVLKKINEVKYNTFGESIEGIKRQLLTGLVLPLGQEVLPKMNEFGNYLKQNLPSIIESVKPVINGLLDAFKFLADNMNIIIPVIAGVVAGLVAFNVITAVSALMTAFQAVTVGVTGVMAALNAVMLANPIGLVAIAIAALVAAGVALWMNWNTVKAKCIEVWDGITAYLKPVIDGISNFFTVTIPASIDAMLEWFGNIPGDIEGFFNTALDNITAWGSSVADWVTTEVPKYIESIFTFFSELPAKLGFSLGFALGTIAKWGLNVGIWIATEVPIFIKSVSDFFAELPGKLAATFVNVMTSIITWGTNTATWISIEVPKFILSIVTFFAELPGKLATEFVNVVASIATWGTNVANWIATNVPPFILSIVNFFAELPSKIAAEFVKVVTEIGTWISNMTTKVTTEIPAVITTIKGFFEALPGDMLTIGKNLVEGLWNGINGAASWLKQMIVGFASSIIAGFKAAFDVNSPSRKTMVIGAALGEGLVVGMESQTDNVTSAMQRMANSVLGVNFSPSITGSAATTSPNGAVSNGSQAINTSRTDATASKSISQTVNIYSPTALTPSETARLNRNAMRELALSF